MAAVWGAELSGAYLRRAYLSGDVSRPDHPLHAFRQDVWSILDQAPAEVTGLRAAVAAGEIDGSVYQGSCACLVGTIANVRGCSHTDLAGITPDGGRPAEQWFAPIRKGDQPVPIDEAARTDREGVLRISHALAWIDEWTVSRKSIAAAIGDAAS